MVDQSASPGGSTFVQGLLQSIEHEAGVRRPTGAPADDAAGVDIDDEGYIDEPRPGAHVSEVGHPQHVRRRRMENPVHMIQRAWRRLVLKRGAHRHATDDALQTHPAHQPLHRATGDFEAFTHHLPPDLPHAVNLEVLGEDTRDLGLQGEILPGPRRQLPGIGALGDMRMIG
jgi:hypothetical protein